MRERKSNYFPLSKKVLFYFHYFGYRLLIFKEVKKGKASVIFAEILWFLRNVFRLKLGYFQKNDFIETIFGKYFITPDLISTITVSPAFERQDINHLLKLIDIEVKKRKKILFLDIGANFGLYTILVGNRFRKYKKLNIVAFEPGTEYLSLPAYELLRKNVKTNKLLNVVTYKIGIGSKRINSNPPNNTLDSVVGKRLKKYDVVFIKLDVDDSVIDALKGIEKATLEIDKLFLLVEDFVDPRTTDYLKENGYHFITKLTVYNSFWKK